jgi:uracil DNA glycosylase
MIIYLVYVRPFKQPSQNYIEIFNEINIMVAALHLFLFTDFVDSPETQYLIGWSLIAVMLLNILVNVFIMVAETLKDLRKRMIKLVLRLWGKRLKAKKIPVSHQKHKKIS